MTAPTLEQQMAAVLRATHDAVDHGVEGDVEDLCAAYNGAEAMTIPTDSELAQAYQQGYQDGRRATLEQAAKVCEVTALQIGSEYYMTGSRACAKAIRELAKLAQPQPATKGE